MFGSAYAGVRVLVLGPGNIGDKCQIIQMGVWAYGLCLGVQTLVILYNITSVVSLLYSSDSRKCMSPLMSVGILYVPHQALYSNITKINKILADARRKRLIRFTMVNNYDCTVVFIKIIQSHIIPYWIAFDDVFMVLYI